MSPRKPLFHQLLPEWISNTQADPRHAHRRRFTQEYRRKRQCVKSLWIGSGAAMLMLGASPGVVAALTLGTTFASFCILDETD